tara:strand:+ start:169 stop:381 length:213 start_codon:yes stop_codon:yes gene_type:complete
MFQVVAMSPDADALVVTHKVRGGFPNFQKAMSFGNSLTESMTKWRGSRCYGVMNDGRDYTGQKYAKPPSA